MWISLTKIVIEQVKVEHLIYESETWKLNCVSNAASVVLTLSYHKYQKDRKLQNHNFKIIHKNMKWVTCQRQRSTVSLFNCLTTVNNPVLFVINKIKEEKKVLMLV